MSSPNEEQLLAELDRRAAAATRSLDDAVERTAIPDFTSPAELRSRRWLSPISIAAGLLVVALVAAALVFSGGGDENTVAGEVGFIHLALPDPEALGYRVTAAFDGTEPRDESSDPTMDTVVTVQGPDDADDPWTEAVIAYSLPSEITTLDGDAVDIGGPEAMYAEEGAGRTVGWIDGDETRYLVSTRVDRDRLVELATAASDGSTSDQRILYSGTIGDVFPIALTTIGRGGPVGVERTALVAYGSASGDGELGMSVATTTGSGARLRATTALATATREVTVRGHDAVVAEFFGAGPDGLLSVSWLEADNTLARADAFGIDEDTLVDHLNQLEPVDPVTFAELAASAEPGGTGTSETFESTGTPIIATDGSVQMTSGEVTYTASAETSDDGSIGLEAMDEGPEGGFVSGSSVAAGESRVLRHAAANGEVLVYGVFGPDAESVTIDCTDTARCDVDIVGPSTAVISGTTSVVFLAVVPQGKADGLVVVGTHADGSETRLDV
ncbi:hypothetical protein [Actinospongicola halichondriae]|uniref:hypothetical protein n=1 Tax=Actinospongicola halichondriae TaxID=3236844 RepID=UPI003D5A1D32